MNISVSTLNPVCVNSALRCVQSLLIENQLMNIFRKIKGYVDELAGVGVPVRHEEYVDASEIEALPYGHEIRLTR